MNKKYDFGKAIRAAMVVAGHSNNQSLIDDAGYELETSNRIQKARGFNSPGLTIPFNALSTRSLSVGTATAGGNLVATDLHSGSFIDVLRNQSVVMNMGATVINDLVGNVAIPRKTSGSTAAWLANEGDDAGQSEPAFDQVTMTPKTIAAYAEATRQVLLQGSIDIEAMLKQDLAAGIATAVDLAALYGTGSSGQPTGVANQTGINAPTAFAAAVPTWAEIVAMETACAVDNANLITGNSGYVVEPEMRGSLRTTEKFSGSGVPIWDMTNNLNDYKTAVSGQVTSGDVFFGNWSDLLIGMWGGLDILVDPYTHSLSGTVRITAHLTCDIAVRHPVSFAYNNDGA